MKKFQKKLLPFLLVFTMAASSLLAFSGCGPDKTPGGPSVPAVKVTITGVTENKLPGKRITGTVTCDEAARAGYEKPEKFRNRVTVVDALVVLHRAMFGEDFDKNADKYLAVDKSGSISTIFGVETFSSGYLINGATPVYPDDPGEGSTAGDSELSEGDRLTVFLYNSPAWDDTYLEFAEESVEGTAGGEITLSLRGFRPMSYPEPDVMAPKEGYTVRLALKGDDSVFYEAVTDYRGWARFVIDKSGEYIATAVDGAGYFIAPYAEVTVRD